MKNMKKAPVSSGNGTIAKGSTMNPHAKGGEGMMSMPGGMGGQNLKHTPAGSCPKLSKLD